MEETLIIKKFSEQDVKFEGIDKKLSKHDGKLDRINTKLLEHDGKFAKQDSSLDELTKKLFEHDGRFEKIEGDIGLLRRDMLQGQDEMMVILKRLDQERVFTTEWIKWVKARLKEIVATLMESKRK